MAETINFDAETIGRMAAHHETLIDSAIARPDVPIGRLAILDASERVRVLERWNETASA